MAMCGDGVGLEGPWEAPRRVHVGVLTIVHATMMVTSTTFDPGILEGQTLCTMISSTSSFQRA